MKQHFRPFVLLQLSKWGEHNLGGLSDMLCCIDVLKERKPMKRVVIMPLNYASLWRPI